MNATVCLNDGDTTTRRWKPPKRKIPSSSNTRVAPRFGRRGKFRGGLGVSNEVRMRRPATIHAHVERTICAPWGLHGGKDALANQIFITHNDGAVDKFPYGQNQADRNRQRR